MLARVLREIPKLTDAVVGAEVDGEPSYDVSETGRRRGGQGARAKATKRAARQARKVPGVAQAEGQVKGAVASEDDLAIDRYDQLTADEIVAPAAGALADRPGQGRRLRAPPRQPHDGPGPRLRPARRRAVARLRRADRRARSRPRWTTPPTSALEAVRAYERAHKDRTTVLTRPSGG